MDLTSYLNKELPLLTPELRKQLDSAEITLTPFEDKNQILQSSDLQSEAGVGKFANGNYLVSMTCPMPGITAHMLAWWFWWHAQDDLRYQIWYPGEHLSISYHKKNAAYFQQEKQPPFQENIQYPVERVGNLSMTLKIAFVSPETFGFSPALMAENGIPLIICGQAGAFKGLVPQTEMAHIAKQTPDGLLLCSRFWVGELLKNPLLRRMLPLEPLAHNLVEHCYVEYRNLAQILPELYAAYAK